MSMDRLRVNENIFEMTDEELVAYLDRYKVATANTVSNRLNHLLRETARRLKARLEAPAPGVGITVDTETGEIRSDEPFEYLA